jgi:hypothetical protein
MPIHYQFIDSETKQTVALDKIDEEICKDFEQNCNPKHFSLMYQTISMIGDYSCRTGEFKLDDFNYATSEFEEDKKYKIMKYIFGKYIYKCWYSR